MHEPGSAEDGVHGTGWQAQGAAYAADFVDDCYGFRFFGALFPSEGLGFEPQEVGQGGCGFLAPRRALVDVRIAAGNSFGIGPAAGKVALAALGLG